MKNKYGFTLVEVLGLVVVIAVIAVVVYPTIVVMIDEDENRIYESYQNSVKSATQLYIERNRGMYPLSSPGSTVTISCSTLIAENYLKDDFKNPKTNNTSCDVKVTVNSNGTLKYEVK